MMQDKFLLIVFKILLDETNFTYVNSIRQVSSKWNRLIKDFLIETAVSTLKSKLLIEYNCNHHSIRNLTINSDPNNSNFYILVNDDKLKRVITNDIQFSYANEIKQGTICVKLHYENGQSLVEFNFGTLSIRYQNEIISEIKWNYDDCRCEYERDKSNPDFYVIQIKKLIISLRKVCMILDLLDRPVQYQSKYIIKHPVYGYGNLLNSHQF